MPMQEAEEFEASLEQRLLAIIRGTRSIMRSGSWLAHRGLVHLVIGPPLGSDSESGWKAAVDLRDRARRWMLDHLGESDLAAAWTPL